MFINNYMTTDDFKKEYLTTEIASHVLAISQSTLKRMRQKGDGPVFYKFGRSIRYRYVDLKDWASKNRHRTHREFF